MKHKNTTMVLVIVIAVFSALCAFTGVLSNSGPGQYTFTSINGAEVVVYGKGIYKNDSLSMASQAIPQDYVVLILGIPGLLFSFFYAKRSMKGLFLLAGMIGFFLYTYMSYSFLAMYSSLFLIYVLLMSCSLIAFTIVCADIFGYGLSNCFHEKPKMKFAAGFMFIFSAIICALWLGRIIPPLMQGAVPESVEHYTTLVIQVMDIGMVAPAMVIAGVLTLKKRPAGYFLSAVLSIKGLALFVSVMAMTVGMANFGVPAAAFEVIIFGVFSLVAVVNIVLTFKSIKQPADYAAKKTAR